MTMDKDNSVNFLEAIADFTFTSKYSRYNPLVERRETWDECVDRVETMHLAKFKKLPKEDLTEIKWAFEQVRQKLVTPSMRSMQFGGKAITAHNARIYNCCVRHVDSIRSFAESFYLLLCGCGVGFGLSEQFLSRLPKLVNEKDKNGIVIAYVIEDTIEGWSDSVEALMNCYFKNTSYTGRKIVFDYSRIRPEGALLKTSGGKAPGYRGLKQAHIKIKNLLDNIIENKKQARLKTIDAYDILMHCADAVLSGGVRRSACAVIFDKNDKDMMSAKTFFKVSKHTKFDLNSDINKYEGKVTVDGEKYEVELDKFEYDLLLKDKTISWVHVAPQRARSNNSVLLLRNSTTLEEFKAIVEMTKQFGEPGFVWSDDTRQLFNPCQPRWAKVLTKNGISVIGNINIGDEIWSKEGWTKIVNKWSTGTKKVYCYRTRAGAFYGTDTHKLVSNGVKIEAAHCDSVDIFTGDLVDKQDIVINEKDVRAGSVTDRFAQEIPDRFYYGDKATVVGFLRGLYSTYGSICENRVILKAIDFKLIEQVQTMLSSIGIKSYYTFNEAKLFILVDNDSERRADFFFPHYDLNISTCKNKFYDLIGFTQIDKMQELKQLIDLNEDSDDQRNYDIISSELVSTEEVFDITVNNASHTYWTQGCDVSNCFEISFIPVTEDGVCGVQFCNLSSINGAKVTSKEGFLTSAKAASILGTLQASYTQDMAYLSIATKTLTEQEALLGVSITGFMDSPELLLNPVTLREGAEVVIKTNEIWAKKLGINPAARCTCVKPEGTNSLVLMSASGAHPHHARRYFRRIQCNKQEPVYKFFKSLNPHMTEPGVWSANKTDDVVAFPLSVGDKAIVKDDLTAVKHLEIIKLVQENWVKPGSVVYNTKPVSHNVSCTIQIADDEWDKAANYIYENRNNFAAVSMLSKIGDKLYKQAPMEAVTTPEDEVKWNNMVTNYKKVDYRKLKEQEDTTALMQVASCAGGKCDLL